MLKASNDGVSSRRSTDTNILLWMYVSHLGIFRDRSRINVLSVNGKTHQRVHPRRTAGRNQKEDGNVKATIIHDFDGCFDGCPWCSEAPMGPNYCQHPSIIGRQSRDRLIIGYSSRSSQIPAGKKHPIWCPIAAYQGSFWYRVFVRIVEKMHVKATD